MTTRLLALCLVFALAFNAQAFGHAGHDEAPGSEANAGSIAEIALSEAAIKNLGIETVRAALAPFAPSVSMNASVEFLPEKQTHITPRTAGRISELYAKVGQSVERGEPLLSIQPTTVGSSPVTLSAPITGTVMKQNAVIGQSVTTETAVMEIADPAHMLVHGVMYETPDVTKIAVDQKVRVTGPLLNDITLFGTVQRVDAAFDKDSRTFNIFALVDNSSQHLLGNMQVLLSVEIGAPADLLAVPSKAILGDSGDNFVFVKEGSRFERRNVTLGATYGDLREILAGVLPEDEVVVTGNYQLQFAKPAPPKQNETSKAK